MSGRLLHVPYRRDERRADVLDFRRADFPLIFRADFRFAATRTFAGFALRAFFGLLALFAAASARAPRRSMPPSSIQLMRRTESSWRSESSRALRLASVFGFASVLGLAIVATAMGHSSSRSSLNSDASCCCVNGGTGA